MANIVGYYRGKEKGKELRLGKPFFEYISIGVLGLLGLVFAMMLLVLIFTIPFSTMEFENRDYYGIAEVNGFSMYPNMYEGQYALIMDNNHPDFSVNLYDIVVYYNNEEQVWVAHRVIDMYQVSGVTYYITQGDNNNAIDTPLQYTDIEGKVVKVVDNGIEKWCFDAWLYAFNWW